LALQEVESVTEQTADGCGCQYDAAGRFIRTRCICPPKPTPEQTLRAVAGLGGDVGDAVAGALAELERLRAGLTRVAAVCDAADEQHDYVTADVDTDVIRLAILDRRGEAPTRVLRDEVATFLSADR
jgi:hypothetical protein